MKKTIINLVTLIALSSMSFGYSYSYTPYQAENGDFYGIDNDFDGRTETIHVNGYYKTNGDYVRGHYRAKANSWGY